MKSLKQHFNDLLKDPKNWNYYNNSKTKGELEEILNNPQKFISSYLKAGNKILPEIDDIIRILSKDRLQHTVSIFLLGLVFYSKSNHIKKHVDLYIKKKKEEITNQKFPNIDIPFCYNWFLICFFHDIGYSRNSNKYNQSDYKMFNKTHIRDIREETIKILTNNPVEDTIPIEIIRSWREYLTYKEKHENTKIQEDIDHGMLAGAYFYYMLKKIYNQKKNSQDENAFIDNSGLFWSDNMLDKVHKPIAWIIAAHNIWYRNRKYEDEDINEYEDNYLNHLIIDEPIVKLNEYPLYFLLCLVDSIDPVKFLIAKDKTDVIAMLDNTYFELNEKDEMIIEFRNEDIKYNKFYKGMISSLSKWLCINCDQYIVFN